jgi:RNA polymerase sigma-70 factor (ECF subfamily)
VPSPLDAPSHAAALGPTLRPANEPVASEITDLRAAVLRLFDQTRSGLLRYVRSLGLGAADAEDVVQDVFLALFVHLSRAGRRTNLRAWLYRVAHNLALRRRMREQRLAATGGLPDLVAVDPASNPEEALVRLRQTRRLLGVLRALPDRDRQCLHLRAEGLAYREIGTVLRLSLGAVAKSITRSVARVRRACDV